MANPKRFVISTPKTNPPKAFAQHYTIMGTIKNDQGQAIPAVLIFSNDSIFTLSDEEGNFVIPNLPTDTVVLHFKSLGFRDVDTMVCFAASSVVLLDVVLRQEM